MATKKLELRIELGDSYVPVGSPATPNNTLRSKRSADRSRGKIQRVNTGQTESTNRTHSKSAYNSKLGPTGSSVSGASVVHEQDNFRPFQDTPLSRKQTRHSHTRATNLSRLFTPHSSTATRFITPALIANTDALAFRDKTKDNYSTTATPLIRDGTESFPAKTTPQNTDMGRKSTNKKVRISEKVVTESRTSINTRTSPSGSQALRNLFESIAKETEKLSFKEMLEVKVGVQMMSHMSKDELDTFLSLKDILEELCLNWKINRMDIDLLEVLITKAGLVEKLNTLIKEYKANVGYDVLPASSERDVTTIVSTLHNLLQGSVDATGAYTTVSFLHYGDVYNFNRTRLKCMKTDLSKLLGIQSAQIVYLAKVATGHDGYVTLVQMPVSITRRFLDHLRTNNSTLMSMGIKGVQITGADGLRYTQSMGYLQEKVPVQTQTVETHFRGIKRSAKTAPAAPSFPPLSASHKLRTVTSQNNESRTKRFQLDKIVPIKEISEDDKKKSAKRLSKLYQGALDPNMDPTEAKFERRVRLARDTIEQLTPDDQDGLIKVLLDQIQKLQRVVASLKKDLREKTRDLNTSQNYVHKAQKEIKTMEMKVETKAQEISKTNDHLLKRVKKLLNENNLLRETIETQEAELDVYRQADKEDAFRGLIMVKRFGRNGVARNTLPAYA